MYNLAYCQVVKTRSSWAGKNKATSKTLTSSERKRMVSLTKLHALFQGMTAFRARQLSVGKELYDNRNHHKNIGWAKMPEWFTLLKRNILEEYLINKSQCCMKHSSPCFFGLIWKMSFVLSVMPTSQVKGAVKVVLSAATPPWIIFIFQMYLF